LFVSLMVILNLIFFYMGSLFFYFDVKDDLKFFTKFAEESFTKNQDMEVVNSALEDKNIDIYFYDLDKNLIYTNDDEKLKYRVERNKFNVFRFRFPNVVYYNDAFYKNDQNYLVFGKIYTYSYKKNIYGLILVSSVLSFLFTVIVTSSSSKITSNHLYPILKMTNKVKSISSNNLSARLNVSGTKDELKDLAEEFNKMINEIEYSYKLQRNFVSDASHELRTPIAVIKGYADLLNRWGKRDEKILDESVNAILEETENMQNLVENLLFIARNDRDALKIKKDYFVLSELIEDICIETRMIDKGHEVECNIKYFGEYFGSHNSLKQALRVFIDNSVKYTEKGGKIKLTLKDSKNDIFIVIEDTGIGMKKEDIPHIFERFYRADKSRTKLKENGSGSGLGLSIAKIIIDKHEGIIHVDSELNVGTKITIILKKNETINHKIN